MAFGRAQNAGIFDYRVLATTRTSTMEKEMNQAADGGYVFGGLMGGTEVLVIMIKATDPAAAAKRRYKFLATSRTSTMERELQQAGRPTNLVLNAAARQQSTTRSSGMAGKPHLLLPATANFTNDKVSFGGLPGDALGMIRMTSTFDVAALAEEIRTPALFFNTPITSGRAVLPRRRLVEDPQRHACARHYHTPFHGRALHRQQARSESAR